MTKIWRSPVMLFCESVRCFNKLLLFSNTLSFWQNGHLMDSNFFVHSAASRHFLLILEWSTSLNWCHCLINRCSVFLIHIFSPQTQFFASVLIITSDHIDDTSTLIRWAPILKLLSNHDLSHTAAGAGHWLLGRPKQLHGTNHG